MLPLGYGYTPGKGKDPYSKIGGPDGYLANLQEFHGNSMWAHWEGEAYVVYSYSTEIAIWHDSPHHVHVSFNEHKYSPTTSHHQSLVKAWLGYQKTSVVA